MTIVTISPHIDVPRARARRGYGNQSSQSSRAPSVTGFVALGPANRVAVINGTTHEVQKYLLVGQRVWQMAFTPDQKYLLTTNGVSNDVSIIDVAGLKVIKTIQVGELPWGVVVSQQ